MIINKENLTHEYISKSKVFAASVPEAKVIDQIDLGTHTIFVADAVNAGLEKEGRPLTCRYLFIRLKARLTGAWLTGA